MKKQVENTLVNLTKPFRPLKQVGSGSKMGGSRVGASRSTYTPIFHISTLNQTINRGFKPRLTVKEAM